MPNCVQVAGGTRGVEAVEVEVDLAGAEEGREYLGLRRRHRPVRGRVLGMVRRGDERPPAGLLGGRRVAVTDARRRTESVVRHRRRIDRGHRPPEQIVVLRVHA